MKLTVTLAGAAALLACGAGTVRAEPVSYFDDVKPLLAVHCQKCHGPETQKSGLRLDVTEVVFRGGESGKAAVVPGVSGRGELMRRITSRDKDDQMPPKGPRLTEEEVARVRQWIDEGAKWPARDDYWAFQPPREVVPPPGAAKNPIDGFLLEKLAAKGISPLPSAGARTLLRRAFFDLLGVPPSPEEAALFLNDHATDAYGKLVDRLLADPRYGERWARHWLDLVRYGESDGYEDDKVRPLAWRYRDYVVRALNADKPYDRFVQEQLAGDELWPDDPDAWIATGFARLGAWDGMAKDPDKQRQDFLNDVTDATGAVFLGVTLGCARCHDHKYDTITQRDYYAVQAFFAGIKRETRGMKVAPVQPEFVTAAWQFESAELARLKSEREALLLTAREALDKERKPEEKKTSDDAVKKRVEKEQPGRLGKLDAAVKSLEVSLRFHEPKVEVIFQEGGSRRVRLLKGGELARPGEEVGPGFVTAMLPEDTAPANNGKRTSLARWLASPGNPLTARVIVNRVWQHHFGGGLVGTPSDFGRNGKRPSHPELLDWLAREFVREGWSLKKLHRLILTSEAWRRASSPDASALAKDPENRLQWRMNRRRLEGEAIRDTLLAVSGMLNPAMGGPGVYARLPAGINVEFPNNDKELSWGTGNDADNCRRSLYLFQRRTLTYPLMEVFDSAPMSQSCAARAQTTVAPQALALFNGEFARECAGHFAARLQAGTNGDAASQVGRAFQFAFTRPATEAERAASLDFLRKQTVVRNGDARAALTDFCHTLLNTNELIHPD